MTARLRRQKRRKHETLHTIVRFGGIIIVGVIGISVGLFTFFFTPRAVDCQTSLHTFCSEKTLSTLNQLKTKRFITVKKQFPEIEKQIFAEEPTVAAVELRRTWHGTIAAHITEAEPLFPLRWNNQDYIVRSNGLLTPASSPAIPILIFEDNSAITETPLSLKYDENTLKSMQFFYDQAQSITPKVQKITFTDSTKVTLYPDGHGPILTRIGTTEEIDQQLTTLQAFFHSTTMDKEYKTLDIRFRDVIMK